MATGDGEQLTIKFENVEVKEDHNTPCLPETKGTDHGGAGEHHHRGKSSESLLDKTVILRHLAIAPGQTVLDAGCGNGYMAKEFSRLVGPEGKVHAIDPDDMAIAVIQEEASGANIQAMVGDVTRETTLPASSFDLIYLSMVFHGFSTEQVQGFEKEVKRLLKPGGRLAIVEIVKHNAGFGPPLALRRSPEELKQTLHLTPQATVNIGEYCYMQLFEKED